MGSRGRRQAFSMVEVSLAVGVLGLLLGASVYLMVGTMRNARRSADLLTEGILGQVALRAVRDAADANPKWLENLDRYGFTRASDGSLSCIGTAVPLTPAPSSPEGTLGTSALVAPAIEQWVTTGSVPAVAAGLTPEEQAQVKDSLAMLAIKVTVRDVARSQSFAGVTFNAGALAELSKRVEVGVYHLQPAAGSGWKPAYTITDEMLTPTDSLSVPALKELQISFDALNISAAVADIRAQLATKPRFSLYDPSTLDIAARVFLVYRETNVEAYLTEGQVLIPGTTNPPNDRALDKQLAELSSQSAPYLRKKLAHTFVKKAQLILDTYRRMKVAIDELETLHAAFETDVAAARAKVDSELARSRSQVSQLQSWPSEPAYWGLVNDVVLLQRDYLSFMQGDEVLIAKAMLFEYLFADPKLIAALSRLKAYPARFVDALTKAAAELDRVAKDQAASPLLRSTATAQWVDVSMALRMATGESPPAAVPQLARLWNQNFSLLGDYVTQADLSRPLPELSDRNPGYAQLLPRFQLLGQPASPTEKLLMVYQAGGPITGFLDVAGRVAINLFGGVEATGTGAGQVRLTAVRMQEALDLASAGLAPPLELSVRLGLNGAQELENKIAPSRDSRLARQNVRNNGGIEPANASTTPNQGAMPPGGTLTSAGPGPAPGPGQVTGPGSGALTGPGPEALPGPGPGPGGPGTLSGGFGGGGGGGGPVGP